MEYEKFIGLKVIKKSRKPFKSKLQLNTVKEVIIHPIIKKPAFTFLEDDSYVSCDTINLDIYNL